MGGGEREEVVVVRGPRPVITVHDYIVVCTIPSFVYAEHVLFAAVHCYVLGLPI